MSEAEEGTDSGTTTREKIDWRLLVVFDGAEKIERVGDEYRVRTVLEDGIAEGGQSVVVRLSSDLLEVTDQSTNETFFAYRAISILVNGQEIVGDETLFFTNHKRDGSENLIIDNDHPLYTNYKFRSGTFSTINADSKQKLIFLSSWQNGDDLTAVFHEGGHDVQKEQSDYQRWSEINTTLNQGAELPSDAKGVYTNVLIHEMTANKNGLTKLRENKLSEKIFPEDPEMVRVKKSMISVVLSYLNSAKGAFRQLVSPGEINKILKL